jgi:ribosomal-protein-alanine N-acetyltransferase
MHFTAMRVEDLPAVIAIEQASFPSPWTAALFLHELGVSFSRVVLARAEDAPDAEILGYSCRWIVADEVHVMNVATAPEHRRHGVATALLAEVLREAEAMHMASVTLEVRRSNAPARALYSSLGFEEAGVRRDYYGRGEDALIMRRMLAHD